MKKIVIDQLEIEVDRKKIKNMYLRVKSPGGAIQVNAPLKISEEYIIKFVRSKMDWILMQQSKIKEKEEHKLQEYITGEKVYLLGEEYTLDVIELEKGIKPYIRLEGDVIQLYVAKDSEESERQNIYISWCKEVLYQKLAPMILHWEGVIGVKSLSWYIRNMKTCWGTCNVVKKRLCFNLQLVGKAPELIEYVVVHELVHLLEGSHNQRFKNFMTMYVPDWKFRKVRLNENSGNVSSL